MSKTAKQRTGQTAEDLACDYLQQQGLQLLERNYRCRQGEIDLIMRHDSYLVFIEVRYRRNTNICSGAESVDRRKQQKLIITATHYLQRHSQLAQLPSRFDVISMSRDKNAPAVDWIQDAFQVS